jgi:hypothetical protein
MANIGLGANHSMLDWSLKVTQPATPPNIFIGLSLGSPTSVSFSEVATGSGYTRQSMVFAAALTPAGSASASNSTIASFGTFSSSAVLSGMFIADSVSNAAGSMLWFGTLNTLRTPLPGDQVVLAAGALAITLG